MGFREGSVDALMPYSRHETPDPLGAGVLSAQQYPLMLAIHGE